MSTVLTKPVLLDETGQAIVGKLTDIQQAIGGTGEFIPINIRVTTPPTKTSYLAGETLDLSGMVVTLVANNGGMYDVTGDCVFSPADGSTVTSSTTEVNISYTWYKDGTVFTAVQPISIKELAAIAVTTPPTITEYDTGDTLDLTGIVVTATFVDGSTSIVTNDCLFSPADGDVLTSDDTTISISYTLGGITKTTTQEITITPIYGAEWDGTATTAWTRTDGAANFADPVPYVAGATTYGSPFDDIMPWAGMVIEERTGGTMVKIPKFYYKLTQNGSAIKVQISNSPVEGFHVSPAHMDRGDGSGERDFVYVGRYQCNNSNYHSTTNSTRREASKSTLRNNVATIGSSTYITDFTMRFTIWLLYLVEFADWNSQGKIGQGLGANSEPLKTGYTDSMPYHTGTTKERTSQGGNGIQYRHIEGLWEFKEALDGCQTNNSGFYIILNPAKFNDDTPRVIIGTPPASYVNDIPTTLEVVTPDGGYPVFFPTAYGTGSGSDYVCDSMGYSTSYAVVIAGTANPYNSFSIYGMFYLYYEAYNSTSVNARIMELPATA